MRRWVFLVLVWMAATGAAVTLARLGVRAVGDQVTGRRSGALSGAAVGRALQKIQDGRPTVTVATTTTVVTSGASRGAAPIPLPGSPRPPAGVPTGKPGPTTSTTTSAGPPSPASPPSTLPSSQSGSRTYNLTGGTVQVEFDTPSTVRLLSAQPKVDFTMEIDSAGPDVVEVRFQSGDHESRLKAFWDNGQPTQEIEEQSS